MKLLSLVLTLLLITVYAFATPIPQGTAQVAARWAAESVWDDVCVLDCKVLLKPDGGSSAYCFTFGINGVTEIDEGIILEGYNLRQMGQIDEGWLVARAPDSYAHAIVAVDDQYGPILEMCDGLPTHMIFREDVKDMGELLFGQSVEICEMYYLYPLENWYRVAASQSSVIVNPRRDLTIDSSDFNVFGSLYDHPGNPSSPYYWEQAAMAPVPAQDDIGYIADVPNFNQEDTDCGPHSSAQATGYWDDHTYLSTGPWDLLIDTDFWGLRDEMRSAMGWVPGSGVTMTEIRDGIETVCNDPTYYNNYAFDAILHNNPAYTVCTDAVDGGRPGVIGVFDHPTYGNHAMTLVGYNDSPSQLVQVHDNWPPSNDEPWLEWGVWFDGYVDVFPGGGGSTTPITLASFTGSFTNGTVVLSWTTACEIDCYGYNILREENDSAIQINPETILATGSSCETTDYSCIDTDVIPGGTYVYQLETIFNDGRSETSGSVQVRTLTHDLAQNTPNPFNPMTTIRYQVPQAGFVSLIVFDVTGKQVAELVNQRMEANSYNAVFDASGLASGIYFYKLQAGDFTSVRKMVLMK